MIDFLLQVVFQTWWILKEAAIFLLFGFALAGVLAVMVPARTLLRFFGAGKVKSVLWASAIGAPLPLCSCGVLPTALGLRRQGATKGATVSFLISTPETGVELHQPDLRADGPDHDGLPTGGRGRDGDHGRARDQLLRRPRPSHAGADRPSALPEPAAEPESADECCAHGHAHHAAHHAPDPSHGHEPLIDRLRAGVPRTVRGIYGYAFRELLDELSYWLVLGIVLSGVIAAALPIDIFELYLTDPFTSMLVMLFIGIPLYTCASAATPVMATLVLKGLNPGAALVFLLAGPATSVSSITVLLKFLGARVVALYLASIAAMSLLAGFTLNWAYQALGIDPRATFGTATGFIPEPLKVAGGLLLLALLLLSLRRTHVPGEWLWLRDRIAGLTGIVLTARRLKAGAVAALVLLYLAAACSASGRARSACASASARSRRPIWRRGCTTGCPGRSRATGSCRPTSCGGLSSGTGARPPPTSAPARWPATG